MPEPSVHEFDALVEPMFWGRSRYTVIRLPEALVADARAGGTRRVAGTIEAVAVNLAITTAPVIDAPFVWAGALLLRRLGVGVGDPVSCALSPVDPDLVDLPDDVREALETADALTAWESLTPATRRRRLVQVDAARTAATRARRVQDLVDGLT